MHCGPRSPADAGGSASTNPNLPDEVDIDVVELAVTDGAEAIVSLNALTPPGRTAFPGPARAEPRRVDCGRLRAMRGAVATVVREPAVTGP